MRGRTMAMITFALVGGPMACGDDGESVSTRPEGEGVLTVGDLTIEFEVWKCTGDGEDSNMTLEGRADQAVPDDVNPPTQSAFITVSRSWSGDHPRDSVKLRLADGHEWRSSSPLRMAGGGVRSERRMTFQQSFPRQDHTHIDGSIEASCPP